MPNALPVKRPARSPHSKVVPVTHEKAKEHATKIYEHSADLEVLLRHKVYPKTIGEINGVQVKLNKVRKHVHGNLKKKDLRNVKWLGVQKSRWGEGFFTGIFVGLMMAIAALVYWMVSLNEQP